MGEPVEGLTVRSRGCSPHTAPFTSWFAWPAQKAGRTCPRPCAEHPMSLELRSRPGGSSSDRRLPGQHCHTVTLPCEANRAAHFQQGKNGVLHLRSKRDVLLFQVLELLLKGVQMKVALD